MLTLGSIAEQLKTRDFKLVVSVVSSASRGSGDIKQQGLFNLVRRWKGIETALIEALNEAKDNVKYLFTIEKFVQPLYGKSPSKVIDILPALINGIKMIHAIARYFNTPERVGDLLSRTTMQLIACCKRSILAVPPECSADKLWKKPADALIECMQQCKRCIEVYRAQYEAVRGSMGDELATSSVESSSPRSHTFSFDRSAVFGQCDLFERRCNKLIDFFSTIDQFNELATREVEGIKPLARRFSELLASFQRKLRLHCHV